MALQPEDLKDKGLFDTHIHGFMGATPAPGSFEALNVMSVGLAKYGVSSFLPSTITASADELDGIFKTIAREHQNVEGAKIEGIFLEGPFFTEKYKGAQNPAYMGDPDLKVFDRWQQSAEGLIKKIAIAPEREGALEFIREVRGQGVAISIGHSDCTYAQAMDAIEAGASIINHTFNAMSPLNHREPGLVGAALNSPREVFCELICDGIHVSPAAAEILIKAKGADRIVLITDAMAAAGMESGEYKLGDLDVVIADGAVRLKDSGALAGSLLILDQAIRNVIDWGVMTESEAIASASSVPWASLN